MRPVHFLTVGAFMILACSENSNAPDARPKYKIVTSRDTILVGETLTLTTSPVGSISGHSCSSIPNKKVTFSTSDTAIITISPTGVALGISPGSVTVSTMAPCNTMTEPKTLTVITR